MYLHSFTHKKGGGGSQTFFHWDLRGAAIFSQAFMKILPLPLMNTGWSLVGCSNIGLSRPVNTVSLSQNGSDIVCWYCISFRIHPPNFLYNPLFLLSTLNIKSNSFSLSILGGSSTCVYTSFWVQGWGFDELDSFDLLKIKWSISATRMIPCTGSDWFQWEDRATPIKGSYDATHGIIRAYSDRFRNHFRRSCLIPKEGSFDTAHGITRSYFY